MRIGILGYGFMGAVHHTAVEAIPGATVTAISSRTRPSPDAPARGNLPQAQRAALSEDIRWTPDWQEIVDDPEIDAIDICLPTPLHRVVTLRALAAGKHVLCEKPMALTNAECDEMLDAAARSGRVFMVGQVLRFMPAYQHAARFVAHGGVQACTLLRRTGYPQWSEWLAREDASGGAILDLLIHDIDQALAWFGEPETVSAVAGDPIDTMAATIRFHGGLDVTVEGGWFAPEFPFSAGFTIRRHAETLRLREGTLTLDQDGREQTIDMPGSFEYAEQMAYFLECCRTGTAPEQCLPRDSAEAVRIALILKASRSQGGKELICRK